MSKYVKLRGTVRFKSGSRKDALPAASLLFLMLMIGLSVFYSFYGSEASSAKNSTILGVVRSANGYGDLCSTEGSIFSKSASLAFLIPGVIFCFVGLAIVTDDFFVSALEQICEQLSLSEDVAGATFMAAGSSTPEFFASLLGVFVTRDEVGIGTIVGSAVFNILVIIGLSAALAGSVLKLDWRPLFRDSVFYVVSIILLFIFTLFSSNGVIHWWEGLILVASYGIYVLFMAYGNAPYMNWAAKLGLFGVTQGDVEMGRAIELDAPETAQPTLVSNPVVLSSDGNGVDEKPCYRDLNPRAKFKAAQNAVIAARRLASSSSELQADSEKYNGGDAIVATEDSEKSFLGIDLPLSLMGWLIFPFSFPWKVLFRFTILDCSQEKWKKLWPITFISAIIWISGISYIMVEAARISGCLLGIPAQAMGLTVLAAGTSVPDALASISVARDGAGDMAVSNAIGSNVFDILLGLGFPWFLGDLILKDEVDNAAITIPTNPISKVIVPIIILFAIMVLFLIILILLKWKMKPLLGYILLGVYFVFVLYTLLDVFVFKFGQ